ncbi:substrate-binding domain-containing protein [Agreia pratensis]|uniref:substrate-binding domain-containing protein n=1 Tax=Agreia pratensis TaxID=150121 RepID=UPI00188A224E|nr:substrate-binding domain-containing protein [Agreia pratensis]MBF4635793.1 substrate-binding domain-containing protein [Agreia pratensis]
MSDFTTSQMFSNARTVGVLAHALFETGPARIFKAAFDTLHDAGYHIHVIPLTGTFTDSRDEIQKALHTLSDSTVGIIALPQNAAVRDIILSTPVRVPIFTDPVLNRGAIHTPGVDGTVGSIAACHLLDLGHRNVAFIAGPIGDLSSSDRQASFTTTLSTAGLPAVKVLVGDWSTRSGYDAGMQLDTTMVTAVFAANDEMAIGVLAALHARGIRVPEQVSVLGADNLDAASFTIPSLTTVAIDQHGEGVYASLSILAAIHHKPRLPADSYITAALIPRNSTTSPPRSTKAHTAAPTPEDP